MKLQVTYTRTEDNKPLAHIEGGPFNGGDYTPKQLMALAIRLEEISGTCSATRTTIKNFRNVQREYEVAS